MEADIKKIMEKQGYRFIGSHAAVKICNWCKQSLRNKGECYKFKFYGVPSWRCCQISPWIACENKCLHCWRAIELSMNTLINKNKLCSPEEIIKGCVEKQRELLSGFRGNKKINLKRFVEAREPSQFAISLIGEPTLYPFIGELIELLRRKRKTSFLVTNGLHPEILKKLEKAKQLPTQLYISVNAPNKKEYDKWHKSELKDAWKRFNKSLELFAKLKNKTRTILRFTLVKDMNMKPEFIKDYARLINKAKPLFVELVAFKSVGFARKRLDYETMPSMKDILSFGKMLAKFCKIKILGKHIPSRVCLLGKPKDKKRMKIKQEEI